MASSLFKKIAEKFFVFINILVALSFLIGCYGNRLDSIKYWYTGLFTLAALYFFLFLLIFLFIWLFVRPRYALISIVAILLSWFPLKHLVQFRFSGKFELMKAPENLRVMSWNVEHFDILEYKSRPEVKQEMISMINKYQPDVACFQEMVGSDSVPSAINYIPLFKQQLLMKDYHYSYNWKVDFDNNHHFGIITFSKYPIINKHTVSSPPGDYNAIFQYSDIVKGGDTVRVYNIHLQSLKFSSSNLRYIEKPSIKDESDIQNSKNLLFKFKTGFLKRRIQSNHIAESIAKSPYPVIVCGDFNDVPNSYAYTKIGHGLNNAFTEKGKGIGRTYYGISPTLRIDNIFSDKRFSVEQFVRVKKKLSDHFPVIADLLYKKD